MSSPANRMKIDLSPLALLCIMGMLMWIAPVVQVFGAASIAGGCAVAGLLQVIRAKNNQTNPSTEPDPAPATVSKQLGRYDGDMDEFWKEWRKPTTHQ